MDSSYGEFVKVMVPLGSVEGLKSRVSGHFGRAPYFAIIDLSGDDVKVDIIENPRGLGYTPGHYALVSGVNAIVVKGGIGTRALQLLSEGGVKVLEASGETLEEVIEDLKLGKLREYSGEGCPGKHH